MPEFGLLSAAIFVGIFLIWFWNSLYIIKEWERGVVLRLGRLLSEPKPAGVQLGFLAYRNSLSHQSAARNTGRSAARYHHAR